MRKELRDKGYRTAIYAPDKAHYWYFDKADSVVTSRQFALSFFSGAEKFRLAQIALVRIAPNFLRQETLKATEKIFGKVIAFVNGVEDLKGLSGFRFYKRLSVPVLEKFLRDETKRSATGNYIYLHIILPHPPLTWSNQCTYAASSTFKAQTDCATSLMVRVIRKLKSLDKFSQSLIVFQSDHGFHGENGGEIKPQYEAPDDVKTRLSEANKFFPSTGIMKRLHSLLLIKRPNTNDVAMETSTRPSQLLDIPETVYKVLKLENTSPTEGHSVFDLENRVDRKVHVFSGIYTRNKNGKSRILGRDIDKTLLGHVSHQQSKGWQVEKDVLAVGD